MARGRRLQRKKTGPRHYAYYFKVLEWYVHCRNDYEWTILRERDESAPRWDQHQIRETKVEHRHYVDVKVELLNPVKKVVGGEVDICTAREVELQTDFYPKNIRYEERPQDQGGGVLWSRWDEEHQNRVASGLLYVDE
jgi:hypothetical protein